MLNDEELLDTLEMYIITPSWKMLNVRKNVGNVLSWKMLNVGKLLDMLEMYYIP